MSGQKGPTMTVGTKAAVSYNYRTTVFLFALFSSVHSLKCIVCSDTMKSDPSVEGVEREAEEDNDIQRCDQFSLSKKHDFIKECPPKSSCIVIFSPKFVVRNCGRVEKDSCKSYSTANSQMCFCNRDFCNSPENKLNEFGLDEISKGSESFAESYLRGMKATSEDDEDLPDGSGDEGTIAENESEDVHSSTTIMVLTQTPTPVHQDEFTFEEGVDSSPVDDKDLHSKSRSTNDPRQTTNFAPSRTASTFPSALLLLFILQFKLY